MWPELDHQDVIQEAFVEHQWADTIHGKLLSFPDDVIIQETHEYVGDVWRYPGAHCPPINLLEKLVIELKNIVF